MQNKINGATFRKMILNGAKLLDKNKEYVDSLNVFPVPDGDTGTNMSLTLYSSAKEVSSLSSNKMKDLCTAFAKGALRGARGNSGVISSQIIKGMTDVLSLEEEITVENLANIRHIIRQIHKPPVSHSNKQIFFTLDFKNTRNLTIK